MPLFSNDKSKIKLVVYFPEGKCFTRLSFIRNNSQKEINEAMLKFTNAIENGTFGSFNISNYDTAIIYDNRVIPNIPLAKWTRRGGRII